MTNRVALYLALVLIALIGADGLLNNWTASIFLGRKLVVLIDYLEFWR